MKNGSPTFYKLLDEMAILHDKKSHDYASSSNPFGNYHFAGKLSKLFDNSDDAGFVGRLGEKLFRLANLENGNKIPSNESIEDTETDICVIVALWIASRRDRRIKGINPEKTDSQKCDEQKYLCKHCQIQPANKNINTIIPNFNTFNDNTIYYFCSELCRQRYIQSNMIQNFNK